MILRSYITRDERLNGANTTTGMAGILWSTNYHFDVERWLTQVMALHR